jgi:cysteine desulfurase/selenocysteine lyase
MSLREIFAKIRQDFPAVDQKVRGQDLVYLDSAATSLKPRQVVERLSHFYLYESSNVHRGAHTLADQATVHFENSRKKVASFIGAASTDEIIFVKGTTEAINLVAQSYLRPLLKSGDVILITEMEHHANIVPWQMVAEKTGAQVVAVNVGLNGELDLDDFKAKMTSRVKLFAFTACSNTLGTRTQVKALTKAAHAMGAKVLVDGAQIVPQGPVSVRDWDCDFFAFSAHKVFGPFGLGVLYARREILAAMPPYQGGGSMISEVRIEKTTYHDIPFRFEAGTPHIAGVVALQTALEYVEAIGAESIHQWEDQLLRAATQALQEIPDVQILGDSVDKGPILSFNLKGAHHSDVGQILDQQGVAVRAGHHCTQPLMQRFGVPGSVRASFSIYNTLGDVDKFVQSVRKAREMLL